MADLAQVAQSGVDPISGSYLSAERRKALFKKSQVSSNIFGGGGALVPISKKSDPETLAIVKSQSTSITTVQSQVNTLSSEVANLNKVIFIQTQTINGVQELVGSLRGEITGFNNSLNNVTKAITNDSVLEQNRIKQENEEQRRAAELGLRAGRESLLEKAIQSALIAPVQAIAEKTQSILSRLSKFFGTLLLGWLTNQGIETLRALSEDNGKKLIEIRDNVLKALGIGAATLFLLNGGFFAIAATITRLSLKIGGWLLKNTVGRFFGALGNLLKSAGSAIVSTAKAGIAAITGTGAKAATQAAPAAARGGGGVMAAMRGVGKNLFKIGGKALPFVGSALYGKDAIERFNMGDWGGATLSAIGAITSFGGPITALAPAAIQIATDAAGLTGEKSVNKSASVATPQSSVIPSAAATKPTPTTAATPQSQVIPSATTTSTPTPAATTTASDKPFEQQMVDLEKQASSIDFTQAPQYGEVNITPGEGNQVSSQPSQVNIKPLPAQTNRVSTQVNVGPAPAPAPNVVYKRIASSAQQRSGAAPTGGSVNQVPAISASNPDNFYVLYSQVNYNVVT
jgi:hypothetical protein